MLDLSKWPISPKRPRTTDLLKTVGRDYLLVSQVMTRLGYNRDRVMRLVKAGRLKAHKEARVWLIDEQSVRDYARRR